MKIFAPIRRAFCAVRAVFGMEGAAGNILATLLFCQMAYFFFVVWTPFFSLPHIIRQLDTMGVSLRYWMRWTIEADPLSVLAPAVLTAGDHYGISPMEFPILNIFLAPAFALPIEWARPVARFVLLLLVLSLTYCHLRIWRGRTFFGVPAELVTLGFFILKPINLYIYRFMPDYLAFILISIGIGLSWEKIRFGSSLLLISLGLLIKPPVVVALAVFFFREGWWRQPQRPWLAKVVVVVISSCGIALFYYLGVNPYLSRISDMPPYFSIHLRNPFLTWSEMGTHFTPMLTFLASGFWLPGFLIILVLALLFRGFKSRPPGVLFAVLAVQFLIAWGLIGHKGIIHEYYFIGLSFTMSLVFFWAIRNFRSSYWVGLTLLILVGHAAERMATDARFWLTQPRPEFSIWRECADLKNRNPELPWDTSYHFRSKWSNYPTLGICFGEIQNSTTAEFGFSYRTETLDEDCLVVDESTHLRLTRCSRRLPQ